MNIENLLKYKSTRYEKKYICSNILPSEVRIAIKSLPSLFIRSFSPRNVNNVYFDSLDKVNYHKNIDGISDRFKIRIRWYNNLFGSVKNPKLEIKIKKNSQNYKNIYQLSNFKFEKNLFYKKKLNDWLNNANIPYGVKKLLESFRLSSINSYHREYFVSINSKIRITLDSKMIFYDVDTDKIFQINKVDNFYSVIELKYDSKLSIEGNKIANEIPFRVTKHSKYIIGIEKQLLSSI